MKEIVEKISKSELSYPLEERPMYHINCAEALLMAANEEYKLGLDDRFIKAVCPFGGGLQSESTCGALLGALSAIGVMFTEDRPSDNEKMKEITKKYVAEFEKEFGSLDCVTIKQHHRSITEGCTPVRVRAAEVFERVMRLSNTSWV
ncbi:C-GCAxxG-C-C family protein [Sedimentibacter sp.]|uniref:C-GCAxxG-C-C family protein n=1 Tax=Sedimentibacter sp. TaxID=1960295 RepID=UPI0028AF1058|nr:C-GCAxxG-C-C family protein [Sedimentibacter sp.]